MQVSRHGGCILVGGAMHVCFSIGVDGVDIQTQRNEEYFWDTTLDSNELRKSGAKTTSGFYHSPRDIVLLNLSVSDKIGVLFIAHNQGESGKIFSPSLRRTSIWRY